MNDTYDPLADAVEYQSAASGPYYSVSEHFVGHRLVLIAVAIELIVAFAIGLSCVIISANLVRALNKDDESIAPWNSGHPIYLGDGSRSLDEGLEDAEEYDIESSTNYESTDKSNSKSNKGECVALLGSQMSSGSNISVTSYGTRGAGAGSEMYFDRSRDISIVAPSSGPIVSSGSYDGSVGSSASFMTALASLPSASSLASSLSSMYYGGTGGRDRRTGGRNRHNSSSSGRSAESKKTVRFAATPSNSGGDEDANSDENVSGGNDRSGNQECDSTSESEDSYSSDDAYADEGEEEDDDAEVEGFFGAVEGVLGNFAAYMKLAW
jgi:hypothetical protein